MSAINCRLLFHDFNTDDFVDNFLKLIKEKTYDTISDIDTETPVTLNSGAADKDTEVQFSFRLKATSDGQTLQESEKYHHIVLSICDLTDTFEELRNDFVYQRLLSSKATVSLTILSNDIYPNDFGLVNVFNMNKLLFGSICNRRNFETTFFFNEPDDDRNEHEIFKMYLDEQRGISDIKSNMLLCFEHDRECLTICFPDVIESASKKRIVEVKMPYNAIRRVIVYLSKDETNDHIKATFTFQVSNPASILIYEMYRDDINNSNGPVKTKFKPGQRFLTWNLGFDIQNSMSHGSCIVADCYVDEACTLLDCFGRLRKSINQAVEFRFFYRMNVLNIKKYIPNLFSDPAKLPSNYEKLKDDKYFPLVYGIQALISRRGEIFDYFFRPKYEQIYPFLDYVIRCYEDELLSNPGAKVQKTIVTLENMLLEIDKANDVMEPLKFFQKLYAEPAHQICADVTGDLAREGYVRVRKVIVTPTRKIYINPELMMGNRSLRKKGPDQMLRVVFRDDDNRRVSGLPDVLIKTTVTNTLSNPLNIGFTVFSYLCSSNSQLRDHGCYFLAGSPEEVAAFRNSCGRFKVECIPKMMSRMGQCFTQARQLGVEIDRHSYSEIFDYTGGADGNGNPYCFSDGNGMISQEFCRKIASDLGLGDCFPSCFQIRFRGYKGIVTLNTYIDEVKQWAQEHGRIPCRKRNEPKQWYDQSLLFRPSQKKFHAPRQEFVEIVKISAPILVSLNKPLINILDQVSEMHGSESHRRMCNHISELMENNIESSVESLIDERKAFLKLNEFPKYILYGQLRSFNLTEETFFRSMLRSSALVALRRLADKMHIRIPSSQGRMMFGVVDETGLLQYGQVFIQYTANSALKYPSKHADKIVHRGPVMITKNPSIVAGDVRMFEAIDLPSLCDLVDVVVFPQSGPRPHPDEMAGSDLDGDEYSIFFDPQLFLDHNEPAFDFTSNVPNVPPGSDKDVEKNLTKHMIDFFTKYVGQDAIGTIANAHLANSDLYGINSEHCYNIALKHNQAVDFAKNGQIPELTKRWVDGLPPERVEKFPNFMAKNGASSYKSKRLLGTLHNWAVEIEEIIKSEEIVSIDEEVKLDKSVLMLGDAGYKDIAHAQYNEYRTLINNLCESYGILNEGELFSGCFTSLKKRISDRDDDNMALFNTQHMIEEQVATIYSKFRSRFFDEFGGIEINTQLDGQKCFNDRETLRRFCLNPSLIMRQKASAYYRVAYENGKILSFAWLISDILSYNHKKYVIQPGNFQASMCPLIDCLSNHINNVCNLYVDEFTKFRKHLQKSYNAKKSTIHVSFYVSKMCHNFNGLDKLLFVFRKWIVKHGIYNEHSDETERDNSIKPKVMDAIVVMYGLGELKKGDYSWLTEFDDDPHSAHDLEINGLGKHFWNFIQFLKTRSFGSSARICLEPVTQRFLESSQCLALYFAAENTFFQIAVNRRFDCLPGPAEKKVIRKDIEAPLITVDIDRRLINYQTIFEQIAVECGCKYIVLRAKADRMNVKSFRVAVKAVGSFIALRKLRNFLDVTPCMDEPDLKKRADMLIEELYKKLSKYNQEENNVDVP